MHDPIKSCIMVCFERLQLTCREQCRHSRYRFPSDLVGVLVPVLAEPFAAGVDARDGSDATECVGACTMEF